MHAEINVRFTISIDEVKKIPLVTVAEFVTEQNVKSVLVEELAESLDAVRVEALCGERHVRGNGEQRFQWTGTDTRTAVTTTSEHGFELHYVEDTAANHDPNSRPLCDTTNDFTTVHAGTADDCSVLPVCVDSVCLDTTTRFLTFINTPLLVYVRDPQVQEIGSIDNHWETFESACERARDQLPEAESKYRELVELVGTMPEVYATALNRITDDIKQLDDVLDVSVDDAQRAVELAKRVSLVTQVLDAMYDFHTELVQLELSIYETWCDQLTESASYDLSGTGERISELWSAVHRENYTTVWRGNNSLATIRVDLRDHDSEIRNRLPTDKYLSYCLETAEEFTEMFTNDLGQLVRDDVQISIRDDRQPVTNALDIARDNLEDGQTDETTVCHARTGLEGTMMLAYQVGYARRASRYCQRLVDLLEETESVDRDLTGAAANRNVDHLEELAVSVITNEATVPIEERVVHLLRENDRSVTKALHASNIDRAEFFDALETALDSGTVADIEVQFE